MTIKKEFVTQWKVNTSFKWEWWLDWETLWLVNVGYKVGYNDVMYDKMIDDRNLSWTLYQKTFSGNGNNGTEKFTVEKDCVCFVSIDYSNNFVNASESVSLDNTTLLNAWWNVSWNLELMVPLKRWEHSVYRNLYNPNWTNVSVTININYFS
jgi:hypothetical protein